MVEAFKAVLAGGVFNKDALLAAEVSRPVLRVLAKYLHGGWDCLGPKDMAALGQDPYDLMGRPFCRVSAMAVMADAYFELGRELNKHGIDLGFAD